MPNHLYTIYVILNICRRRGLEYDPQQHRNNRNKYEYKPISHTRI